MKLSIIIVNWNVADLLAACLGSLPAACGEWWPQTEVIVVDNASTDASVSMVKSQFGWARVLALNENAGFAEGNNAGIATSRGEYVYLLNPDTVSHPLSVSTLLDCMEANPGAGIAGPRLVNPDGTLQPSRRRFPGVFTGFIESTPLQAHFSSSTLLRDFYLLDRPDDEMQDVGWLSGAALLCRREALEQAGLFDPGFFMFSEEVDLCRRFNDAGWRIVYVPDAAVTHYGGQSTEQDVPARHINFNTSKLRYFRLHEGTQVARLLRFYLLGTYAVQMLSEAAKWALGHRRDLRASRLRLYGQVLRSGLRERRPRGSRVLLVTGEYPPARGGVGDYTCKLQGALARRGMSVKVLTKSRRDVAGADSASEDSRVRDASGVPLVARLITLGSTLCALRASGSRIAHFQYQTGAYDLRPTVNFLPLLLKVAWRGRSVVTFHDLRVPYLFPKAGPLRSAVVRIMARTASASLATNPEDFATLREWGVRRVSLVPIGSNIPCDPSPGFEREEWRAAHGVEPQTVLLAYFGFLNSTKGLDDLLHVLKQLQEWGDYRLLMVGGGLGSSDPTNRATAAALNNIALRLGVEKSVLWTGYLEPQGVSDALLSADMAVLPYSDGASFRRGSLLAVLEHGLPLVTTFPASNGSRAQEEWPQLVDGKNALLVTPGRPEELAVSVRRIASDAVLQAALREGAASLATFFSWDRIAATHLRVYGFAGGDKGR